MKRLQHTFTLHRFLQRSVSPSVFESTVFEEGKVASRETCNKHWLDNFQHDFRISGELGFF